MGVYQKTAGSVLALCRRRVAGRDAGRWFLFISLAQLLFWVLYPQEIEIIRAGTVISLARGRAPVFETFISGESGENALVRPMGVLAAHGRVYVSDVGAQRILVFDRGGRFLRAIGAPGNAPGHFLFPKGMAADGETLYVADMYTGLISQFDKDGVFLGHFALPYRKSGLLQSPSALAVFGDRLYVADVKRSRVFVFALSDGALLEEVGLGEDILAPNGVAVDRYGNVYVTSSRRQYIAVYTPEGRPLRLLGGDVHGATGLLNPRGIVVGMSNRVYVASNLTHELLVYGRDGELLYRYGRIGGGEGEFFLPNGLAMDNLGNLFVVDTGNSRVAVLAAADRGVAPESVLQADTRRDSHLPLRDAAVYRVAEDYVAALVAGEHEAVSALLTASHRLEWRQDSFLLRPEAKELFPTIELIELCHTFPRFIPYMPGNEKEQAATLTLEYRVKFSNERETTVARFREVLMLRLEGGNWRISASQRDILQ
jgi:DNA-binding beta-propeller fold protein YncE